MDDAKAIAGKVSEKIQDKFTGATKHTWVIVLVVAAMFILILVIIYVTTMLKASKLQNVILQTTMIGIDNREVVPFTVPAANMSLVLNGQEYSYSFWIFLGGLYSTTSQQKIIIQRGNSHSYATNSLQISPSTSPLIMMDPVSNIMYFCAATSAVTTSMVASDVIAKDTTGTYTSGYLVTTIDYVPLQRWVNIAMVVKDMSMYIYMDADLYSVITVSDISTSTSVNPMIKGTNGDLLIGDKVNYTPGYISMTRFYNYALTQNDIQSLYNAGPVPTSWLSYLGLKNYGVRTPVYALPT